MGDDTQPNGHYAYKDDDRMWVHPDGTKQPYPPKSIGSNADNPYVNLQSMQLGAVEQLRQTWRDLEKEMSQKAPGSTPPVLDATEFSIRQACNELANTLISKRKDYGKGNIERHGEFGVIVRADDKLARLTNLWKLDSAENEPIEDSWKDLAGYAIIGLLFRQGKW